MGGYLAQPAKYYPHLFDKNGIFGRNPYLLPNVIAAVGILLAIIQGMFFLEETLVREEKIEGGNGIADHHDYHDRVDHLDTINETPANERSRLLPPQPHNQHRDRDVRGSIAGSMRHRGSIASFTRDRLASISVQGSMRQIRKRASFLEEGMPMPFAQNFDIRRSSFGTMHSIKIQHDVLPIRGQRAAKPRKTFNRTVAMVILAMSIFAFHQMAFISILPVYVLDPKGSKGLDLNGGLGMDLPAVGAFLVVNGFITLFVQGFVFPIFVEWAGVWNSFKWMILLYPTTYIIVPFISAFPKQLETPGIYLVLILQAFYGIIVFPCALIIMKNAIPSPLVLGRVNGVAMSAACLARTISCPLIGAMYSVGGSATAWFGLAAVAVIGMIQFFFVPKEEVGSVQIDNGLKKVMHHDMDEDAVDDISIIESVR
jgi:hypothetical protein